MDSPTREVRAAIVAGTLAPGTFIDVRAIARANGSSVEEIRQAMASLVDDDLLRDIPDRGLFVSDISVPDVIDVFHVRHALEPYAARCAAESVASGIPTDLDSLRSRLSGAVQSGSLDEQIALARDINEKLAWLSGSPRIAALLLGILRQSDRLRHAALRDSSRASSAAREHLAILDAVIAGDATRAAAATSAHLDGAQSAALNFARQLSSSESAPE